MKQILPTLFLFFVVFVFPKSVLSAISLNISNIEKQEASYSLDATLSGLSTSSNCYVQVVITAPGSPHYFGQTWSPKGEWFKYISSPAKEYITEYFVKLENDQPTKILFNTDTEDADYKGPGEYLVKLNRYTGSSSSPAGDSNSLTLNITDPTPTQEPTVLVIETPTSTPTSTPTPTSTATPTPTKTPTTIKTPTTTPTPTPTKISTPTKSPTTIFKNISPTATILGDATDSALPTISSISATLYIIEPSPSPEIKIKKQTNYKTYFFIGLFLAVSSSVLLYFRHRKD